MVLLSLSALLLLLLLWLLPGARHPREPEALAPFRSEDVVAEANPLALRTVTRSSLCAPASPADFARARTPPCCGRRRGRARQATSPLPEFVKELARLTPRPKTTKFLPLMQLLECLQMMAAPDQGWFSRVAVGWPREAFAPCA